MKMNTLADRIKHVRKLRKLTQAQLCEMSGVEIPNLKAIEQGKNRNPTALPEIAKALGVSPGWLRFGTNAIDTMDEESIELMIAWQKLEEPHKSALKAAILQMSKPSDTEKLNK